MQKIQNSPAPSYIIIEGPIGVGKTTLVSRLAEQYDVNTLLEVFEENPFLSKFYEDKTEHAFQTEMFFLLNRYRQQKNFKQTDMFSKYSVSDYLFVKSRIFASLTLTKHELNLYDRMFNILKQRVPEPDVVVHLQAPTDVLWERIQKRGRPYEQDMDREYLERLRQLYLNFFRYYDSAPVVDVDTEEVDFTQNDEAVFDLMGRVHQTYREALESA
jgi:deoxyadenosine/deoxycytidine kinase